MQNITIVFGQQSPPKSDEEPEHRGFFKLGGVGLGRKSVSFCTRDNVRVYERYSMDL